MGMNTEEHVEGMAGGLGTQQCIPAHLELLVVIPIMDNYKAQIKSAAEVEEVVSLCLSPCVIVKVELVLLL